MDEHTRARVDATLRQLERLLDDPRPLLSFVVLENGRGLAVQHPSMANAEHGTLTQREAVLRLVQAFLIEMTAALDEQIELIVRATSQHRTNRVPNV